jgi:hypothetical protein
MSQLSEGGSDAALASLAWALSADHARSQDLASQPKEVYKEQVSIPRELEPLLDRAAECLLKSECLVITAGAGMGVDSSLPDFRGRSGFWNAEGGRFVDLSTPWAFQEHPHRAWGFYGHFLNLCRAASPHEGFQVLRRLARRLPTWVLTSNVDGHFQKAGFDADRIVECHGSLSQLQCSKRRSKDLWASDGVRSEAKVVALFLPDPVSAMYLHQPLEESGPTFLAWRDGALRRVAPPALGEALLLVS